MIVIPKEKITQEKKEMVKIKKQIVKTGEQKNRKKISINQQKTKEK